MKHEHPPHVQRVIAEHDELSNRHEKLGAFFSTPLFADLPADEQEDMRKQHEVMTTYGTILKRRLTRVGAAPVALDTSGGNSPPPPPPPGK